MYKVPVYVLFEIAQSVTVKLYSNCILYVLDILQEENGIAMFYTSWIENFQEFYRFADANSGKVLFLLIFLLSMVSFRFLIPKVIGKHLPKTWGPKNSI